MDLEFTQPVTEMSTRKTVGGGALVRNHVSEEHIASVIRMARICELGTTLAITSNRSCKVVGSTSNEVNDFFVNVTNHSGRTRP
jgi:hypothetical protein